MSGSGVKNNSTIANILSSLRELRLGDRPLQTRLEFASFSC